MFVIKDVFMSPYNLLKLATINYILILIVLFLANNIAIGSDENIESEDWSSAQIIVEMPDHDHTFQSEKASTIHDPYEKFNRKIFAFNKFMDRVFIKPAALGYRRIFPQFVRNRISSFLINLQEPLYCLHNLLTLEPKKAMQSFSRFTANTIFGVLGLFDVAKMHGLGQKQKTSRDTFAKYGFPSGAYIMLPIFGPSTVRDSICTVLDFVVDPLDIAISYNIEFIIVKIIVDGVVKREYLLRYDDKIAGIALDEYAFMRSFYAQQYFRDMADEK